MFGERLRCRDLIAATLAAAAKALAFALRLALALRRPADCDPKCSRSELGGLLLTHRAWRSLAPAALRLSQDAYRRDAIARGP